VKAVSLELSKSDADSDEPGTGSAQRSPDGDTAGASEPAAYRPLWREAAGVADSGTERDRPTGGAAAEGPDADTGRGRHRYIQGTVEPDTDGASRPQSGDTAAGSRTGTAGPARSADDDAPGGPQTRTSGTGRPAGGDTAVGKSSAGRPLAGETASARETDPGRAGWRLVGDPASLRERDTDTASKPRPGDAPGTYEADRGAAGLPRRVPPPTAAGPDTNGGRRSRAGGAAGGPGLEDDRPLLGNAPELRASWHRVQAAFVDDPRGTVSDAADLVEHATQALIGALRQRQRELRQMWDGAGSTDGVRPRTGGEPTAGRKAAGQGVADSTEQLRLLVQRYRALFNQICRP
jgi:hypothetical protein